MSAIVSTCFRCEVPSVDCVCDQQPVRPEWLTGDGRIDTSRIGCPCCGEVPWCGAELAAVSAEWEATPELVVGAATYGRPR